MGSPGFSGSPCPVHSRVISGSSQLGLLRFAASFRTNERSTMTDKVKGILATVAAIAALVIAGGAVASATGGDNGEKGNAQAHGRDHHGDKRGDKADKRITGGALVRASRVALASTGGGRVSDTEVGDEEGYYE